MSVSASDLEVGKCFVTSSGQVRRILEFSNDGKICYEARGKKSLPENEIWGPKTTVNAEKFASDVEREVRWDYDPDFSSSDT